MHLPYCYASKIDKTQKEQVKPRQLDVRKASRTRFDCRDRAGDFEMKMSKQNKQLLSRLAKIALLILIGILVNRFWGGQPQDSVQPQATENTLVEITESQTSVPVSNGTAIASGSFSIDNLPESDGVTAYVEINGNVPFFTEEEKTSTDPFEYYSDLDSLGRCGVAYANICVELQPTEKRGDISSIKPTGWKQNSYPDLIEDGKMLYNRCHLIGFQLAGENANKLNLITGTRYLNVIGMLPFENIVDDYLEEYPDNHVLYRVTPMFVGDELVARGVLMEAYSVEDHGQVEFCIYCFNIQPGIWIDYATGENGVAA